MEAPDGIPDPIPDVPPKKKRVVSPESLKNLRRGVLPSEREVIDGGVETGRADSANCALGSSTAQADEDLRGAGQLADMRHVYTRPAAEDRTQGQKMMRAWSKDAPSAFLAAKTRLEEKWLETQAGPKAADPAEIEDDPGTEKCEEMYERLLTEWGEELR